MRRRTRLFVAAIAAVGVLLVAAELILRAKSVEERIKAQYAGESVSFSSDPDLGAVLTPMQTFEVVTPEFTYTLRTDHAGFPNREPWPERLDIAVLGNSLITGSGVGYEGQFSTLLQERLDRRTVLNFGVHGGGTRQQLLAYRKFAAPLKPRLVIASLWLVWEIDNSRKFEDWLHLDPRPDFTEYRLNQAGEGRTDERSAQGTWGRGINVVPRLLGGSRLVRKLRDWYEAAPGTRQPIEQVELDDGQVMLLSARNEARLLSGWLRPGIGDLRELFFAPLEELRADVEANGGRLLVVLIPGKEEPYVAKNYPEILGVVEAARAELVARKMDVLDLYPEFERALKGPPPYFLTDMHLNSVGHRIVANAVAAWASINDVFTKPAG
jgi:lysophospholipase L1-like esterase